MTEREFDLLMDVVRDAVVAQPMIVSPFGMSFEAMPVAANDNGEVWPMIPFPDGWYASC